MSDVLAFKTINSNIYEIYNKLCNEYNILPEECPLFTSDWTTFIVERYDSIYKKHVRTPKQLLYMIELDSMLYNNSFTFSNFYYNKKKNKMEYLIAIPEEQIYKLSFNINYEYKDINITDDEVKEFIEICLRHEIGHVLHKRKLCDKMGIEDALKYTQERYEKDMAAYYKSVNYWGDYSDEIFYTKTFIKYHKMYAEREANKAAKIDFDRMLYLHLKIMCGIDTHK